MRHLVLTLILLLSAAPAFSQQAATRDDFVTNCKLTPPNKEAHYPGTAGITKFNNLVLPTGKSVPAAGQFVYLTGRVFDERCVPLANAKVEMWQATTRGDYRFPAAGDFANPYPLFAGSGAAITDNNGQFFFYTVFPGPSEKRAPLIAFHISNPQTRDLFTTMYFTGDSRNVTDAFFGRLPAELKPLALGQVEPLSANDPSQGLHVHFDMTVSGADGFRRF